MNGMDILAAIDDAVGERCACGCGRLLPADGPSAHFADAACQRVWYERQVTDPGGVRGTLSVAKSDEARWRPELAIECDGDRLAARYVPPTPEPVTDAVDAMRHALQAWGEVLGQVAGATVDAGQALGQVFGRVSDALCEAGVIPEEPPADPMQRALWLRQHRNTGPAPRQRAPRRVDPRRSR